MCSTFISVSHVYSCPEVEKLSGEISRREDFSAKGFKCFWCNLSREWNCNYCKCCEKRLLVQKIGSKMSKRFQRPLKSSTRQTFSEGLQWVPFEFGMYFGNLHYIWGESLFRGRGVSWKLTKSEDSQSGLPHWYFSVSYSLIFLVFPCDLSQCRDIYEINDFQRTKRPNKFGPSVSLSFLPFITLYRTRRICTEYKNLYSVQEFDY